MTDELSAPLGLERRKPRAALAPALKSWFGRSLAVLAGCAVLAIGGYVLLTDDPLGGEPVVVVSLQKKPASSAESSATTASGPQLSTDAAVPAPAPAGNAEGPTVTVIDGLSGKRQQVTFGKGGDSAKVVTIEPAQTDAKPGAPPATAKAPDAAAAGVTVRPASPAEMREAVAGKPAGQAMPQVKAGSAALLEPTRFGMLPKIASDGTRPLDAYAGAPDRAAQSGSAPRLAIVLSRLGVSANTTAEALAKLPAAVTLGFVPSTSDLDRLVARARGEGREVLLQVPMEPFDFPDNDPGPQALMVSLAPEQNLDRLRSFMGRTQGYVGLAPFMGARFVAQEKALSPVLNEAGKRGLLFFDDATASRSVTAEAAAAQNVPFARADIVLDQIPSKAEIDAQLRKLEALGRERGFAIGSAHASPATVERLALWAKGLGARGIALVPLTALINKPKSS